ncbi:MAG: acyl-CoA dehydrogenase family protein [Sulfuricaulis sp.]|nr:acyl-CoA dehydrogenase family protein [Sulfuricaulis sp.]
MYNLHLTAEQLEIRDTVRDFVAQEIKPVALKSARLEANERHFPPEIIDKASQMGLRTLALSEAAGGAGADNLTSCIVTEELAAGDVDFAATLAATSILGRVLFDQAMTPEQRARFLPRFLADDRYHLAYADHEPDTDTELGINYHRANVTESVVKTTAVKQSNGDWLVNGVKNFIINAPLAGLIAVQVKTDTKVPGMNGVSALLVTPGMPGLTIKEHDPGWYHGTRGELVFKDCRVPAANLLGAEGKSPLSGGTGSPLSGGAGSMGRGIPQFEALNLGIGRAAYEAALDYAKLRIQGGRPIIEHQAIGTLLAGIAIKLEVARNMVWRAAWASDHPDAYTDRSLADLPLETIARVFTSEAVHQVALDAAECFGAMGVMRDMPLQKYVRDALICLHSDPSVKDAKLRIAEAVAGYERK